VADSATTPLLVDSAGQVYAATHITSDGREELVLTFAQADFYNSYLELAYGLVNWATRGLFIGERRVYAVPELDDLFLSSALYTGAKASDRITAADLQCFANWQATKQAQPQFVGFRIAFVCNGAGSQSVPGDPLTAKAVALGPTFAWINHTWDHPILDTLSYADVLTEFTKNEAYLKGLPLTPYMTINAVTPNISGLSSADAMQAIYDAGIRNIVSDTSEPGQANPSPNIGIWNALQPMVLEIPRIPTDLYFNVESPDTWIPEYEALKGIPSIDYPTIIDQQSDALAAHMLAGNKDPWMFHQLNAYDYDGAGHSLLSDLLDATFTK
jgi:peptidoglycan/xylan/chitin deacetylase (PgdA/CDA1 family)